MMRERIYPCMGWLLLFLLLCVGACRKPEPLVDAHRIEWDGNQWRDQGGGGILMIDGPDEVEVGAGTEWLERLSRAEWESFRVNEGPTLACRSLEGSEVSGGGDMVMVLECGEGGIHVAGEELSGGQAELAKGDEIEDLRRLLGGRTLNGAGLVIVRSGESLGSLATGLSALAAIGIEAVVVSLDHEPSLLTPVLQDPAVSPKADEWKEAGALPVRVMPSGELVLGVEVVQEGELEELCRRWSLLEPEAYLVLLGGEDLIFGHSRRVIRQAAAGGVDRVKFHADHGVPEECLYSGPPNEKLLEILKSIREGGEIESGKSEVPESPPGNPVQPEFRISLAADGSLRAQEMEQSLSDLQDSLAAMAEFGAKPIVMISAEDEVPQSRILEVLRVVQGAGIEKVSLLSQE